MMRLFLTFVVFAMASVTLAGSLLTLALSFPNAGLASLSTIGWVAGVGFLVALPLSYWIAGLVMGAKKPDA